MSRVSDTHLRLRWSLRSFGLWWTLPAGCEQPDALEDLHEAHAGVLCLDCLLFAWRVSVVEVAPHKICPNVLHFTLVQTLVRRRLVCILSWTILQRLVSPDVQVRYWRGDQRLLKMRRWPRGVSDSM